MTVKSPFLLLVLLSLSLTLLAQPKDFQWVKTNAWQSRGSLCTEKFTVTGNKWRLKFRSAGKGSLWVVCHGELPENNFTLLRTAESKKGGTRYPRLTTGEIYLEIIGDDQNWSVSVEQYFDRAQEWKFLCQREKAMPLLKQGAWGGEGPDELVLQLDEPAWMFQATSFAEDKIEAQLFDHQGICIFQGKLAASGDFVRTWLYQAGTFRLKITAPEGAPWQAETMVPEK